MTHQDSTPGPEPHLGRSVSIEQAARTLGVTRRTIYNRIRDGRLHTVRTIGGSQRVLVSSLRANQERTARAGQTTHGVMATR